MRNDVHLRLRHTVDFAQDLRALARHHHQAVAAPHQFLHHLALRGIRVAQHRVQRRHHRHPHFLEQRQQMAARRPAVDAELMLHAEHVRVVEVQKIRRAPVGIEILLQQLEAHPRRIVVALRPVIHRADKTFRSGAAAATASHRSVVNVAMPQRRGSNPPTKAMRLGMAGSIASRSQNSWDYSSY